jgi:hypothetical protein
MGPIREEFRRIFSWEAHHHRLLARLAVVFLLTMLVDLVGTVTIYLTERHAAGTEITSLGDALFFTTVQLLTVSSQLRNPLTVAGRVIDVGLEVWAVLVVAGSAGAMADFFQNASARSPR